MSVPASIDPEAVGAVIARHANRNGALLPILHDLQAVFGHVPHAAVAQIAAALNVSRAEVHGVVTFYHDYRDAPAGRHAVKLCQAEACQAMGARTLARHICGALGIELGGTTADGRVTVEAVYCLGLCATSPSMMIDGAVRGRVTPATADRLIGELS